MSISQKKDEIRILAKEGKKEEAWLLLQGLIVSHPDDASLWSLRGSLYAAEKNYSEAIASLKQAIILSPQESIFYYHRGRYNLSSGNILQSINDFSEAIAKDNYGDSSYSQEIYFHRAEAFIKLGKKQDALSDLMHVPEDYKTWTFKLRSKADLIADCGKL